jgi:hypothetical protein
MGEAPLSTGFGTTTPAGAYGLHRRGAGTSADLKRFSAMAFLPAGETREPKGLILDAFEASRRRAIEAERARAAQQMVAQFFGLAGPRARR